MAEAPASTSFETLLLEVENGIATVTLNRPERRNAFTLRMAGELLDLCDLVDDDDAIRVLVLTGAGSTFCAGAELEQGFIGSTTELTDEARAWIARIGEVSGVPRDGGGAVALRFAALTKPTIAVFNGAAVGIGATMTLPLDIRIASPAARFGFVFTRRGLVPEAGSSWFLPRIVGVSRALEWCLTGRVFDAREALEGGLVSYVLENPMAKAREIAAEIASTTSPVAVAVARRLVWSMLGADDPWAAHTLDSQAIYDLAGREDVAEGIASFFEKRPPRFTLSPRADLPSYAPVWPLRPTEQPS